MSTEHLSIVSYTMVSRNKIRYFDVFVAEMCMKSVNSLSAVQLVTLDDDLFALQPTGTYSCAGGDARMTVCLHFSPQLCTTRVQR